MMNDAPNFHSYCWACRMVGYTETKLQILNAKLIKVKWLRLMDFKRLRKLLTATVSFVMSVCPSDCNNSAPSGRISNKLDIWVSFEGIQISLPSANNNGTLYEDLRAFLIISGWVLCAIRYVSENNCIQIKTRFTFNNLFFTAKILRFIR
jgi:hypothetical protein